MTECSDIERWLAIPDFEGSYEASDHGRVRSLDRTVHYVNGEIHRLRGRVLSPALGTAGRLHVTLHKNGVRTYRCVHTLVLTTFVGPPPPDTECCHGPGGPLDNRLTNLRWDTRSENQFDAVRDGTHSKTRLTHCPRNHPLVPPNLVRALSAAGHRSCLACARARNDARAFRHCGAPFDLQAASDWRYAQIMNGTKLIESRDRTHCPQGHPLAEPNLQLAGLRKNLRRCLACARAHVNEFVAKRLNRPFSFTATADEHYRRILAGTETIPGRDRTECPRGHTLTQPNLIPSALTNGRRGCLACDRARGNQCYAKRRGRPFDFNAVADQHYRQIMLG